MNSLQVLEVDACFEHFSSSILAITADCDIANTPEGFLHVGELVSADCSAVHSTKSYEYVGLGIDIDTSLECTEALENPRTVLPDCVLWVDASSIESLGVVVPD